MRKVLINHSWYPSARWSPEQIACYDEIVDFPLPEVSPYETTAEVMRIASKSRQIIEAILSGLGETARVNVFLWGEPSYCFALYEMLKDVSAEYPTLCGLAFPTCELRKGDNTPVFVLWREIPFDAVLYMVISG